RCVLIDGELALDQRTQPRGAKRKRVDQPCTARDVVGGGGRGSRCRLPGIGRGLRSRPAGGGRPLRRGLRVRGGGGLRPSVLRSGPRRRFRRASLLLPSGSAALAGARARVRLGGRREQWSAAERKHEQTKRGQESGGRYARAGDVPQTQPGPEREQRSDLARRTSQLWGA